MIVDCIVIGGGVAGLGCAHKLIQNNKSVALVEAKRFGGLVKSLSIDNFTLEQGAATLSANSEFLELCRELNISDKIIYPKSQKYRQYVVFKDCIRQVPRNPVALIRSNLLNLEDKFRLVFGIFKKFPNGSFSSDLSISDFLARIFCKSIAERLAAPVMRGIFGGDIDQLKAELVFSKLFKGLNQGFSLLSILRGKVPGSTKRGPICCLKGGNQLLVDTLWAALTSKAELIQDQVVKLEASKNGFTTTLAKGASITSKQVFIATSGKFTAEYLHPLAQADNAVFSELNYAPIAVFHIAVAKPNRLPENSFGVLFPKNVDNILGVLFNSKIFPHVAAPDYDLITVCLGGYGSTNNDMEQYQTIVVKLLNKYFKLQDFKVLEKIYWPNAIPQYDQQAQKILALQKRISSNNPGLYFIGADVGGVGVPARLEHVFKTVRVTQIQGT